MMQHWINTDDNFSPSAFTQSLLRAGDLFVDIETTGLSRNRHQIYLIGLAEYTAHGKLVIHQFFADQPSDEPAILHCFCDYLETNQIHRIITFNGNQFDLPFLCTRADVHGILLSFDAYERFDIYKESRKRADMLQLASYRQKSLEQFLGIEREDLYSGGELIKIYRRCTSHPDADAIHLLQLHNYEDVRNMYRLMDIFSYDLLFSRDADIERFSIESYHDLDGNEAEELIVTLKAPCFLSGELSAQHPVSGIYLRAHADHANVRIPLYQHMARMYYSDYKNYYYLPTEDMAIHKSVSLSVDPAYRQKATLKNCYSRVAVTDDFLSSGQFPEYVTHILRSFLPTNISLL